VSAGGGAVSDLPTWAILPIAAAVMLLSPVIGFLAAIGVEIAFFDSSAAGSRQLLMQV
jgi:hypothetical protein